MADLKEFQRKMEKTLDVLASDFAAVRAGRANKIPNTPIDETAIRKNTPILKSITCNPLPKGKQPKANMEATITK